METLPRFQWKHLFALWSLQGIAAFCWLLLIPTDTNHPLAFGFSATRLGLVGIALSITIVSALLWLQPRTLTEHPIWLRLKQKAITFDLIYFVSLLIVISVLSVFGDFQLLPGTANDLSTAARLLPLLLWFGLSSLELTLFFVWNNYPSVRENLGTSKVNFRSAILLMCLFALSGSVIAVTKTGITPVDNWGGPAVPFWGWQILIILLVIGICVLFPGLTSKINPKWIPLGIYILTVVLWLSQPVNAAFTATPPRAPNFEIYPFSDPQFYAQYAQSALIGQRFSWPEVPTRPFYVAFLTWLHLLGNQNYNNVIFLQTLVLAFFPVSLYILGNEIGGRSLGLSLSILTVFRDINSNLAAPFGDNVTYSKLFLSELPAALLISLVTLLTIRWMRRANHPLWYPLLIGGILGAATLIRLQSFILITVIILLAVLTISNKKQLWKGISLLIFALAVTITPWIIRNYFAAGGLVLDNPISQTMTMARRWSGSTGNEAIPQLPGENEAQYSSRLTKMAIESFRENPGFILSTAANHFVNSEIASLLAFPLRDKLLSPSEVFLPEHPFWKTPVTVEQLPLFVFYLFLFALGVVAAARNHKLPGLLPLGLGVLYNFWTALFFSSGQRFIVPVDWSVQLYQLLGLLILCGFIFSFTQTARATILNWIQRPSHADVIPSTSDTLTKRRFVLSLAIVLLVSGFLPITESIFPQKYSPKSQQEIVGQIGVQLNAGEVALYGRAIYPRYYKSGDGEPATDKLGYKPSKQARLVFYLIGPNQELVIFDLDKTPDFFPNTSDVFMIGTQMDNYFSPRVLLVTKNGRTESYSNK
jgi:hypothetical protein